MCMRKSEHGLGRATAAGRATARVTPTIHDCGEPGHPCIVGAGLAPAPPRLSPALPRRHPAPPPPAPPPPRPPPPPSPSPALPHPRALLPVLPLLLRLPYS